MRKTDLVRLAAAMLFAPIRVVRGDRFDDGCLVTTDIGGYRPNAWGLFDMHGNAAEATRSGYRPRIGEPEPDERKTVADSSLRVARGGSWRDRPSRCRSSFRLAYPA